MIEWLKHFPLKVRQVEPTPCRPRAPLLFLTSRTEMNFGGTKISVTSPIHFSKISGSSFYIGKQDTAELRFRDYPDTQMPSQSWQYLRLLNRRWDFWKPNLEGVGAHLSLSIQIIKRTHPEATSFFHPAVFEAGIIDFLNAYYGHETHLDRDKKLHNYWVAPANWLPIKCGGIQGARFDILPNKKVNHNAVSTNFSFPIGNAHLLSVLLNKHRHVAGSHEIRENLIDLSNVESLLEKIATSIEIELSAQAQAQMESVKREFPDAKLSDHFAPLQWPVTTHHEPSNQTEALSKS